MGCAAQSARKQLLETALEETLTLIVSVVNTKRDHIPPVVSADAVTFPFEIVIAGCGAAVDSLRIFSLCLYNSPLSSRLGSAAGFDDDYEAGECDGMDENVEEDDAWMSMSWR